MQFFAVLANSWKTILVLAVLLQILFILLKIMKIFKFSWLIIILPLYIGIPLVCIALAAWFVLAKAVGH